MRALAWSLVAVLGALSLCCIAANYSLVWRELRSKPEEKMPSKIPIIGGLLGFLALWFCPLPGWSRYAWLPPALDPGCYLVYFLARKLRGCVR